MSPKKQEVFQSNRRSLKYVVIAILSITCIVTPLSGMTQTTESQPIDVLEGLDVVMLVQGKELQGDLKITATRGRFRYLFASEENKAAFVKDPSRYEIQLGGHCARMGPTVGGNPDLFAVYKGRVYVFGSEQCKKLFETTPEKYIEPSSPPETQPTSEGMVRGRELIEKAVVAMGGAKLDQISSYQQTITARATQQQGVTEFKTTMIKLFPDQFRQEQVRSFGTVVNVITSGDAFVVFRDDRQSNLQAMDDIYRSEMERRFRRNPIEILRAHTRADFKAIAIGTAKVGEIMAELVAVEFGGIHVRLALDRTTARILSLTYRGRSHAGEVGEIVQAFSDFREVSGLTLPFKADGSFNGVPEPEQSYVVEATTINAKIDPASFDRPKAK